MELTRLPGPGSAELGAQGGRCLSFPLPLPARWAGHAPDSGRGAHSGPAMRSGAERRGSSAAASPGSPPLGRGRLAGPDAPPAPPPPAAGQPRARDSSDARAQPRPLFQWSKWKKRMGSSMSAAAARRPVFDDKEDGEKGRAAGTWGAHWGLPRRGARALSQGGCCGRVSVRRGTKVPGAGRRPGASQFPGKLADGACGAHARPPCPAAARRAKQALQPRGVRVGGPHCI